MNIKSLLLLLLLSIFFSTCKSNKKKWDATVYGTTHIAMPKESRDIGYDSIQLIVGDSGKLWANFCYPNNLRFKKDTIYTGDSAYRRFGLLMHLAPAVWLAFESNTTIYGGQIKTEPDSSTSYYFGGYKITVHKLLEIK